MAPSLPPSLRRRIVDKVGSNKLTIVVGPTGCGKSSLVPQALLDGLGGLVLCTQPRRLAVVAVASYVARQRGAELGGDEVGYHVGQDRAATNNTKLLFATAGVLLEEMKARGINALTKYEVVLIDECHERSVESDLVLTVIKEFMVAHPRSNLRLVLMSATFDKDRYASFFRGVPGCDYVDTIPIQTAESIDAFYSRVQTFYLEEIARTLVRSAHVPAHDKTDCINFFCDMKEAADEELSLIDDGKALSKGLLACIASLVNHLHNREPADEIFLVFAPTYRQLDQIYNMLEIHEHLDLDVLHSTIDIEDCLSSMQAAESSAVQSGRKRKVLLASAIADSSVTIPNVSCVIDTCRALEVRWNPKRSGYNASTVWASQAICDQRRGRTGRTCGGKVFRLVYQSFFNNEMELWEQPKLELASCRDEVLSLLSSHNKVMSDPQTLLRKCIDPPSPRNVTDAIQYLKEIKAIREVIVSRKRKLVLTDHGELMSALPFAVEEAGVIIYGGKAGYLHEALALVAIETARPQPIVSAFGNDDSNEINLTRYHTTFDLKGQKSKNVAHLAAYIYWYKNWNAIRRHEMKEHFKNCTSGSNGGIPSQFFGGSSCTNDSESAFGVGSWTPELDRAHSDWCRNHFINPSSVKSISQYVNLTLQTLYRLEPEWLRCQALEPAWNRDGSFEIGPNVFASLYGVVEGRKLSSKTLVELQSLALLEKNGAKSTTYACIHYLNGRCIFGDDCLNAHSVSAPRPPCRFHLRGGGCTNDDCLYSHDDVQADTSSNNTMVSPEHGKFHGGAFTWLRQNSRSIMLFGNCGLDRTLESMGAPPGFVMRSNSEIVHFHRNRHLLSPQLTKCVWSFPSSGSSSTDEETERHLQGLFMSAAANLRQKYSTTSDLEVGVSLEATHFSKFNVMVIAQHAGFSLEWYEDFDCAMFPNYTPCHANSDDEIETDGAKFFVFKMRRDDRGYNPRPRMMEIREGNNIGIELEMSTSGFWTRDLIASELLNKGILVDNVTGNYAEAKRTSALWKLVGDGSIACPRNEPDCNKFELVSPVLQSEKGLRSAENILREMSNLNVTVNRSMGFHVHFDVGRYSINDLTKICQQFLKYEDVIDSMLPLSRRTGSRESDQFFRSNIESAKAILGKDEAGVMTSLGLCKSYRELADIMNPSSSRYYKLNMQNLVVGRQTTIEFRQHSSTANYEKVDAWVRFCVRFCENSVGLERPTYVGNGTHNVDKQFDDMFKNIVRDSMLYSYYRGRRHLLSVDQEGEACCHGCATGQECSG